MKWYVSVSHSLILSLETDWETTLLGHKVELEWRLKVFSSTSNLSFWISPHPGTLTCSWILKFAWYILSIANEVDLLIFCCVCFVCDKNMCFSNILIFKKSKKISFISIRKLLGRAKHLGQLALTMYRSALQECGQALLGARPTFEFWFNLDSCFEDFLAWNCT